MTDCVCIVYNFLTMRFEDFSASCRLKMLNTITVPINVV